MGMYVANQVLKLMIQKEHKIAGAKVLVLGITFKENCPDIRNSRVIDVINELKEFRTDVSVYDPWADSEEVKREYGLDLIDPSATGYELRVTDYDAVVLAVAHDKFKTLDFTTRDDQVLFDIKSFIDGKVDGRL
jgi:UDP-N-acetyl-D-galactosamine dehydrogenase